MMLKIAVVLLAVLGASSAALLANNYPGCYPKFTDANPRPNCATEGMEGWQFWQYTSNGNTFGMNYKLFAKKVTHDEAKKLCGPWDEAICENEYPDLGNWRCHPTSATLPGEIEGAILPAYNDACIKNGNRFWTGATRASSDTLYFSDRASTKSDIGRFDKGDSCVVFEVSADGTSGKYVKVGCSEKYQTMCRISPVLDH